MLGFCLQGGGDDTMGSRQTGVQEASSQQGQVEDKAQPAGEFWRLLLLVVCTDEMQRSLSSRGTYILLVGAQARPKPPAFTKH